ncbi:denticleless protein homolog [Clytia hemisphaerica]|uniref:Denticleless protein n=1 Tax=Clytia hemisphaerica TaxID=252671 RepID=A0A7M5WTY7_9CNID
MIPLFWKRQYTANTYEKQFYFPSKIINGFTSSTHDEYPIEGEMGVALPPFVARFSESILSGNMLGVADEDGHVKLLDTRKTKNNSLIKEWSAHSNAVFDMAWVQNESKMITASGDQTARLWDVEKAETTAIFRGHTCSLKSVAVAPHCKDMFVTGARDGKIMIWDARCNRKNGYNIPVKTISGGHVLPVKESNALTGSGKKRRSRRNSMFQADAKASVTSAIFLGSKTVISAGACDGVIKQWDLRKSYANIKGEPVPIHTVPFPGSGPRVHGYSSLVANSSMSRIYAVCANDVVYEYSTTNNATVPMATYKNHVVKSFYVKAALSPDDRFLLCGSTNGNAYIWQVNKPKEAPWLLKGHESEVTSVTWSPHQGDKIVTCSDDNTFRIWRMFQKDYMEKTDISGVCERWKDEVLNEENAEEPTNEVISNKPRLPYFCPAIRVTTNRKVLAKWDLQSINVKPPPSTRATPVCKTPDASSGSAVSKRTPSASISTSTTPMSIDSATSSTNRPQTLNLKSQNRTSPAQRSLQPTTPKSSRSFMETWLKSPLNSKESPVTIGANSGNKLKPISEETETEKLDIVKKGECSSNMNKEPCSVESTEVDKVSKDSYDIVIKEPAKQDTPPNKGIERKTGSERVVKRRLINKYAKNRTTPQRATRSNTPKSENIRTLMLSGKKRKRKSEDDENTSMKCSKSLKLDGCKENINEETKHLNNNNNDNVMENLNDVIEIIDPKEVLSENNQTKDLLDIAED